MCRRENAAGQSGFGANRGNGAALGLPGTPAAVASVQGTEFILDCSKKEGTHLGVFEGTVEFQPAETAEADFSRRWMFRPSARRSLNVGVPFKASTKVSLRMQVWSGVAAGISPPPKANSKHLKVSFTPAVRLELRRKFMYRGAQDKTETSDSSETQDSRLANSAASSNT